MRIAIVDDIKEERDKLADVLTKQLSRRGIHVNLFEFENGEDFLIAAKERPFTVVFLDIYNSSLLYTYPSPRDRSVSRIPSYA